MRDSHNYNKYFKLYDIYELVVYIFPADQNKLFRRSRQAKKPDAVRSERFGWIRPIGNVRSDIRNDRSSSASSVSGVTVNIHPSQAKIENESRTQIVLSN